MSLMRVHLHDNRLLQLPAEAEKAAAIAFLRIFLGIMWLFEITVGHNWKIGGVGSGTNPAWLGEGAGDAVREETALAVEDGTYAWAGWLFESVISPNAELFAYTVIALQLSLGVAFIVGVFVRPLALMAITMDLSIFMLGNSRIPPFFMAMHLFVLFTGAGKYYGLDGLLLERTRDARTGVARAARWLVELPVLKRQHLGPAIALFTVIGLFFFLTIPTRETPRMGFVALELAALAGFVAVGLYAASRFGDRYAAAAAALRIFVGFKLLHEIWARTTPGVNALPGFAGSGEQAEVWQVVVDNHWTPFAWVVDSAILPAMGFWVVVFGVIQLVVGVCLVVGYRTRLAGTVGLGYLAVLVLLGMTRYAPFVLGLLVPVVALNGGRVLSLDSIRRKMAADRFGLPIPKVFVPALVVLAGVSGLVAAVAAFQVGITPAAYVESMPAMVLAFVSVFAGLLAFVGWLQEHPSLDHSGEVPPLPAQADAEPEHA